MSKRKTNKVKLAEGYGTGIGPTYQPFHTANGSGSVGTASMIPDPFEGRMVHVLSTTEEDLYYILRWDDNVEHIREQYPLNVEYMNEVRKANGLKPLSSMAVPTTDFLVDYKDGSQHAYSVKFKATQFNPDSIQYRGRKNRYAQLIERQHAERLYWESQGIDFSIVTSEDINRVYAKNIAYVMSHYNDLFIVTREQKLMYLLAHKIVTVPMTEKKINPKELAESMTFDIDVAYEKAISYKGVLANAGY